MSSQVSLALFVPLIPKSDKIEDVKNFLEAGCELSKAEEGTVQWYGVKFHEQTPPTFAVFDTFHAEEGRKAHLDGKVAEALMANASTLLNTGPEITSANILASHFKSLANINETTGFKITFTAKPDKVQAMKDLFIRIAPLLEEEANVVAWYAMYLPGTDDFMVVDFITSEGGMDGKFGAELMTAKDFVVSPPKMARFEIVAASVKM